MSDAGTGDSGTAPADRPPRLDELLRAISADFDRASTDDERRARGFEQLAAITRQLQRDGVPSDVLRPVTAIMHALMDVDRGCVPPVLQARRRQAGGPPIPSDELRQRGLAAAAVTLFMRAADAQGCPDQTLDRAARKVARRIERWRAARGRRVAMGGRQSLAEAVKKWRERAMGGRPAEHGDASIYAEMLGFAADGKPPAWWAEWILTKGYLVYR